MCLQVAFSAHCIVVLLGGQPFVEFGLFEVCVRAHVLALAMAHDLLHIFSLAFTAFAFATFAQ